MSILTLIRDVKGDKAILGKLYFNGGIVCYTLENAAKAIPCGLYNVQNSKSPKFKRELPLLWNSNVPAKRGIRIHVGNDAAKDSSGCILVGMGRNYARPNAEPSLLESALVNPFPTALYNETDRVKNPNRQMLIEVFQNAMAMNLGKTNEGIFSVESLLKVTAYPQPKEGTLLGFHFDRDLLRPFEADMDSLAPSIKWSYFEAEEAPSTYEAFIQAKIRISWADYPRELIEARKERNRDRAEEASAEKLVEKAEAIMKAKKEQKKGTK